MTTPRTTTSTRSPSTTSHAARPRRRTPRAPVAAFAALFALLLSVAVAAPAAAATVTVTTWGELVAAFDVNGNTVVLGNDITAPAGGALGVDYDKSITLDLTAHTLTVASPSGDRAAIAVPYTSSLTIEASGGGINATAGSQGAGIGGELQGFGTITINGGTINATGGLLGAGIGGGFSGNSGTIIINGGNVTATGGDEGGAGIGVGYSHQLPLPTLAIHGAPDDGAATDGGDGTSGDGAEITNPTTPAGVGYSAVTSRVGDGGRIVVGFHYLVGFDSAGGTAVVDQTVTEGNTVTEPADPARDGYQFAGWELAAAPYDFTTPVTDPFTLTATWTSLRAACIGTDRAPTDRHATGVQHACGA